MQNTVAYVYSFLSLSEISIDGSSNKVFFIAIYYGKSWVMYAV